MFKWCPRISDPSVNRYIKLNEEDPDDSKSCAIKWCPAVQYPCYNKWLCGGALDPELLEEAYPKKEETTRSKGDSPEATTDAPKQITTTAKDTSWASYIHPSCEFPNGTVKPDTFGCYPLPPRHDDGSKCLVGVCIKGKCMYPEFPICASM
uniref:Basic tail secreted protein n=1 Tax=Rhipicephalus zambeziensis TaxID=60191 RepID=A0A224Y9Y4_9ACAR